MGNALEREFTEEETESVFCPKCGRKHDVKMDMLYARSSMKCKNCHTDLRLKAVEGHVLLAYEVPMERRLETYLSLFHN